MKQDYLPRYEVGAFVALDMPKGTLVVKILDIKPRFNEVFGMPVYITQPPLTKQEEIMCQLVDASFRRATPNEVLLFYKGEYDHGHGD